MRFLTNPKKRTTVGFKDDFGKIEIYILDLPDGKREQEINGLKTVDKDEHNSMPVQWRIDTMDSDIDTNQANSRTKSLSVHPNQSSTKKQRQTVRCKVKFS